MEFPFCFPLMFELESFWVGEMGKSGPFYRPRFIGEYSRIRGHSHRGSPSVTTESKLSNNRTFTLKFTKCHCK